MIWALSIISAMLGLVAIIVVVGLLLPVKHKASRTIYLSNSPDAVFATITNWKDFPSWRSGLKSVKDRPGDSGRVGWVEVSAQGTIPLEIIEMNSTSRLVTKIADAKLPFGGTWTWEIQPDGNGSRVTVTEDGEIYNPVFRFMARFVFGYEATMKGVLGDLERKFAERK